MTAPAVTFFTLEDARWFSDLLHDLGVTDKSVISDIPILNGSHAGEIWYRLYWWPL